MTTNTKGAPRPEPAGIHRRGFLRMMSTSGAALAGAGAAGMAASAAARAGSEDEELLSLGRTFDRLVSAYEDAQRRHDAAYEPIEAKHGGQDAIRRKSFEELKCYRDDLNSCPVYLSSELEMDAIYEDLEPCVEKIRALRAMTVEGLAVKGRALRRELLIDHPDDEPVFAWDWSDQITWELIANIERVAQMARAS